MNTFHAQLKSMFKLMICENWAEKPPLDELISGIVCTGERTGAELMMQGITVGYLVIICNSLTAIT